jgi:hypothetical protein
MALTISDIKNVRPLPGALVRTGTLLAAAELGEIVYIDSNDKVVKARANAAGTTRAIGIIVAGSGSFPGSTFAAGQEVGVCVLGPVAGITGMDPSLPVFVSSGTAGDMTQTAPSGAGTWTHAIGYPLRSDVLFINPQAHAAVSNS